MRRDPLPTVTSPGLDAFAVVAAEFCRVIVTHNDLGRERFLASAHEVLPRLYSAALNLPPTAVLFPNRSDVDDDKTSSAEDASATETDSDRLTSDEAAALCMSLGILIGERQFYRTISDPLELDTESSGVGFLADDFTDIYRDVHDGLAKWRRGESGEALWEWRFNFENHWGEHLTRALRALHILTSRYEFNWPADNRGADSA